MKNLIPQQIKNFYHLFQAILANIWFGFPSRKIKVIGVTGTDGKTTAAHMIGKVLEESGKPARNATHSVAGGKVALASTISFKIGAEEKVNATKFTTLSSFKVQEFILKAVKLGCQYLILETSSHSLDQYRVWGIQYDTAVITNVTREHLDYHKTMENYCKVKTLLFKNARVAVVNRDMERLEDFLGFNNKETYTYTIENRKLKIKNKNDNAKLKIIKADNLELDLDGSKYQIQNTRYQLHLPGKFNIENALAAVCVGLVYGVDLETSARALEKIKGVPGRLEKVPNDRGLEIIIDYAVTPNALEKLYSLIREAKKTKNLGSIIAVLGSCGERDRGKRPIMGKIVSRYADYVIVTNEDPYNEDPLKIIDEVFSGITGKEGVNCWRIPDRREAIKKALQLAKRGDIVIVSGKGAEETMAIKKERIPWNDKKVILEEIKKSL